MRWPLAVLALLTIAPLANAQAPPPAGSGTMGLPPSANWAARLDPGTGGWSLAVAMPPGSAAQAPSIDLPPGAGWRATMDGAGIWSLTFTPPAPPPAPAAAPRRAEVSFRVDRPGG